MIVTDKLRVNYKTKIKQIDFFNDNHRKKCVLFNSVPEFI